MRELTAEEACFVSAGTAGTSTSQVANGAAIVAGGVLAVAAAPAVVPVVVAVAIVTIFAAGTWEICDGLSEQ